MCGISGKHIVYLLNQLYPPFLVIIDENQRGLISYRAKQKGQTSERRYTNQNMVTCSKVTKCLFTLKVV